MKTIRSQFVKGKQTILVLSSVLFIALVMAGQRLSAAQSLIATGAVWKYLDNGSDQGTAWREPGFNDSIWGSGPAQLGFGDGDEATLLNNASHPITFYFRRSFAISQAAGISNLTVRLLRDDGGVVYLNGVEVFRSNMPTGPITYNTLAATAALPEDETTKFYPASVEPHLLVDGANVLAVEIHQVNVTSSDVSFDLDLTADGVSTNAPPTNSPPTVRLATPADGAQLVGPTNIWIFAVANDPDGYLTIKTVEFFAGDHSLGIRTNYPTLTPGNPFVLNWENVQVGQYVLTAIATDDHGATGTSAPVHITVRTAPSITFVTPHEGDTFSAGDNIRLGLNVADDRRVLGVEFFANASKLGDAEGPLTTPYGAWLLTWSNAPAGDYSLTARIAEEGGSTFTSAPLHIHVLSTGTNITVIAMGSRWKFLDNGTDQGTAWQVPSFDDSSWAEGPAQLGYGDGDEATVVSFGPDASNKYITTYFRKRFRVADAANIHSLNARLLEDDGSTVYLNGVEVFRSNLPSGSLAFNTFATVAAENQVVEFPISPSLLVEGTNLLAVEVHQVNGTSSDLSFDFGLTANGGSQPPPTNHPPFVQLNAPQNGEVFAGPTNILLRAFAQDPEDGYDLQVEFFSGTNDLGRGVFVPTTCPSPYCPYFTLTWSNVPPGNYRLIARATDKAGASSISAPAEISVRGGISSGDSELHVVGVYGGVGSDAQGNHERGDAAVAVNRSGKAVILFLSSYEPVLWHVSVADGTTIEKVILSGYYPQDVTGLPSGVEIISFSYEIDRRYIFVGESLDSGTYLQALPQICDLTHLDISSFHGAGTAPYPTPFVIDSVQDDERLHCNYPQPTPLSQLPDLRFSVSFYRGDAPGGGSVFTQNYTLGGAENGARLLPAVRVVADGGGVLYYGATRGDVFKVDSHSGEAEPMDLGPNVPELSWPMGVAFNSQNQRILLASLGGEGFLYSYAPDIDEWSLLLSMYNRDVDCLVYHPISNLLYAAAVSHSESSDAAIYESNPDGGFRRAIRLPALPFDIAPIGYHSELVSVGDYLVLLLEPDLLSPSGPPESRIYLIDPRTSEVWLTYRRLAPLPELDSDGDGVPDSRDHCPNTPPGQVVNGDGCSIAQLCPCNGDWIDNSEYVGCVIERSWSFYRHGLITADQRRAIIAEAAQSTCGGSDEARLNSQPQATEEIQRDGLCLIVSGGATGTCILECSTNLVDWVTIQTVVMPTGSMEVVDTSANQSPSRFYRLRMPAP